MRKKVSIVVILVAWLCANGAMWDVAQVFAWGRMFAGYARTLSVGAALRETFDLDKPCEMCRAIQTARTTEKEQAPASVASAEKGKVFLTKVAVESFVFTPPPIEWPRAEAAPLVSRTEPVPVPPPRV